MKQSSFLTKTLAMSSGILILIAAALIITTSANLIKLNGETRDMIKMCCATSIAGFALTAICSGFESKTSAKIA